MMRSWAGMAAGLRKRDMKRCDCYVTGLRADLRVLGFVVSDTVTENHEISPSVSTQRGNQAVRLWGGM